MSFLLWSSLNLQPAAATSYVSLTNALHFYFPQSAFDVYSHTPPVFVTVGSSGVRDGLTIGGGTRDGITAGGGIKDGITVSGGKA